jgi:OHCU decarboxylase
MRLDDLNALDEDAAARELLRCCGSSRWARMMAAARPFAGAEAVADTADAIWSSLDRADWLEAFMVHPKIGETKATGGPGGSGKSGRAGESDWSRQEQAGVARAAERSLRRLNEANRHYEARFGYIFIVCATGKTAEEMLALLEHRLLHDAGEEMGIAAEEQRKITRLRLKKLLETDLDTTT